MVGAADQRWSAGISMQLLGNLPDALVDKSVGALLRQALGDHLARCRHRYIDGQRPDLTDSVRFGLCDLIESLLASAGQRPFESLLRLGAMALGLFAGSGDDGLGLLRGVALPATVIGQQGLGLLLELTRLFDLRADCCAA